MSNHTQWLLAWAAIVPFSSFIFLTVLPTGTANTECVWATGLVKCNKNQTKVLGAVVELWELDSPPNSFFQNPLDPDDKSAFTVVDDPSGLWKLDGCGSDRDWFTINRPEFYLRVYHHCNTDNGEWLTVWPVFRVFVPRTYDWHISHPIVLDMPVMMPASAILSGSNNGTLPSALSPAVDGTLGQQSLPAGTLPPPPFDTDNNNNNQRGAENGDDADIVSDGTRRNNTQNDDTAGGGTI